MRELLVDGYNVIRQTGPYRELAETDLDAARVELVTDVGAFAHSEFKATVVFDAHANPSSTGAAHDVAGVTVIFSRFGVDADAVLESLARRARERGHEAIVVTSDAQVQWTVARGSVTRRSAEEFGADLRAADEEWRESVPLGSTGSKLESRIDPETARVLARWARGED